jgi:chromosome segregation ATPase
LDG